MAVKHPVAQRVQRHLPAAATHTPYGMTEALPVATLDPTTLDAADPADRGGEQNQGAEGYDPEPSSAPADLFHPGRLTCIDEGRRLPIAPTEPPRIYRHPPARYTPSR